MLTMFVHSSIRILQMQRLNFQHFFLFLVNPQFLYYVLTMKSCLLHNLTKVANELEIIK